MDSDYLFGIFKLFLPKLELKYCSLNFNSAENVTNKRRRTDNTMAKRRRTDNTMAKRRRTDNTMAKRKRTKGKTMIYKTYT
jgi:hypothetical protein